MFAQRHEELYGVVALSGTSYSRLDWRLDIQASFFSSSTTICRLVIFRYHRPWSLLLQSLLPHCDCTNSWKVHPLLHSGLFVCLSDATFGGGFRSTMLHGSSKISPYYRWTPRKPCLIHIYYLIPPFTTRVRVEDSNCKFREFDTWSWQASI